MTITTYANDDGQVVQGYDNWYARYGDMRIEDIAVLQQLRGSVQTDINEIAVLQKLAAKDKDYDTAKTYSQYIKDQQRMVKAYSFVLDNWWEHKTRIRHYPVGLNEEFDRIFGMLEKHHSM